MKLSVLAERIGGRLIGDGDVDIQAAASLEEAGAGQLSYVAMHTYREKALTTKAAAILVVSEIEGCPAAQVVCEDPYLGFARAMLELHPPARYPARISDKAEIVDADIGEGSRVFPFAYIGQHVKIGRRCVIFPHVFIADNVTIGDDCLIYSNVSIREKTQIGNRVILQDGCRIGTDGYGFARESDGHHVKIPQVGRVVIEDDVEIGANCCIDRATFAETRIGHGTKFDNLVQVGHNVRIGHDCLLVAQVGIAGSAKIGNNVTLAGQSGVSGHLSIGDGATIGGKSGVTRDVPPDEVYTGYPAMPHRVWSRIQKAIMRIVKEDEESER